MRVLGIDPSLRAYGWAVHDSSETGVMRMVASGHEGTLPSSVPVARFMHFRALIQDLLRVHDPEVVGIESPAYGAGPFQTIHFGLMMFSLEAIFERRKDVVLFDPATLKSLVKGTKAVKKGGMTKLDMQRFVLKDTSGSFLVDNNEADAYCVALFAGRLASLLSGAIRPDELSENERSTFVMKSSRRKTGKGVRVKRTAHVFRENSRYFRFSDVPAGSVSLPTKTQIPQTILDFLEDQED